MFAKLSLWLLLILGFGTFTQSVRAASLRPGPARSKPDAAVQPKPTATPCEGLIFTIPPAVNDPYFGAYLVRRAEAIVAANKKVRCHKFVERELSAETLGYLGFSSYKFSSPRELSQNSLERLSEELNASQILLIDYQKKSKALLLQIYRMDYDQEEEDYTLTLTHKWRAKLDAEVANNRSGFIRSILPYFVPNTVALGFGLTEVQIEPHPDYEFISTRNKAQLPEYLTSFSLGQIDHPSSYNLFDAGTAITPRFFFFSMNQTTRIGLKEGIDPEGRDLEHRLYLKTIGACGTFDATLSLHWPLGTTQLLAGIGPCLYASKQEDELSETVFDGTIKLGVGHRAFFSQRLYAYTEINTFSFGRVHYSSDWGESTNISRFTVGLGWFFPSAEHSFGKFVHSEF